VPCRGDGGEGKALALLLLIPNDLITFGASLSAAQRLVWGSIGTTTLLLGLIAATRPAGALKPPSTPVR
jgi:hypothetical protein